MMTKTEFKMAYINYCNDGGHSYDPWDLAAAWDGYQANPAEFDYLLPFREEQPS
jgi:hypothetical protein